MHANIQAKAFKIPFDFILSILINVSNANIDNTKHSTNEYLYGKSFGACMQCHNKSSGCKSINSNISEINPTAQSFLRFEKLDTVKNIANANKINTPQYILGKFPERIVGDEPKRVLPKRSIISL